MKKLEFTVSPEESGLRLDRALSRLLPDSSRTFLQKLVKDERISCDGTVVTVPRFPVRSGMTIVIDMPEISLPAPPEPEEFDFPILFEDEQMLVIDKPAGVVVHPAAGNPSGTVVNAIISRYPALAEGLEIGSRPGIVHRLDKDTSGCLVIAKTPEAQFHLGNAFANREVEKSYLAIIRGVPQRSSDTVITLIGRHPVNRQKMAVVERNGKEAVSRYRIIKSGTYEGIPMALAEVKIATGRTHQIRVHMNHIGHPVIGDQVYGGNRTAAPGVERQLLHARTLSLPHPVTRERCSFEAPVPEDFQSVLECFE